MKIALSAGWREKQKNQYRFRSKKRQKDIRSNQKELERRLQSLLEPQGISSGQNKARSKHVDEKLILLASESEEVAAELLGKLNEIKTHGS